MGIYDDLVAIKGSGTPVDTLAPVLEDKVRRISAEFGAVPADYISFLEDVGSGELGNAAYMLYDGLIEPGEVYGNRARVEGILLFGDDFRGLNAGFDTRTWRVVEIDPASMQVLAVAPDFKSFIRDRLRTLA
jgi:hypothetical protein